MTKDRKVLYTISISLLVVLFLALFLPNNNRLFSSITLIIFAIVTCIFIKKRDILSINKKQVILLMGVIGFLYLMVYYLTGLYFGYFNSAFKLTLSSLLNNILPISAIVISIEIVRSVFLAQRSKAINVITFITCLLADIVLFSNTINIDSFNVFMDLVGLTLFPAITSNILYTHISKRYGFYPNIVYRLLITLYLYIIPYVPRTPDSLFSFYKLIIPLIVYLFISALYDDKRKFVKHRTPKWIYITNGILIAFMVSVVMLVSNQFKYRVIVIGSESMTGELNKGDALIYERYDDQDIKEGEVIVFEHNGSTIIHRVIGIENINGQTRYYTKGDANEKADEGYVVDSQIKGVSNLKISYIGYPTIWVRDIFSK